jgi:hypothetical protein
MEPPRTPDRRPALALALAFTLLVAGALPAAAFPRFSRGGYEQGQRVEVKGLVTDPAGRPIRDVQVVLELGREVFDFRTFGRTTKKVTPVTATTNERGEYTIVFPWDDYYNSFELAVGVPVRGPRGEILSELERQDLSRRIEKGTPIVATVVVQNAEFIRNLREFVASVDSADERRVYEQLGRPDKVQVTKFPDRDETAWWYFRSGRVYRFADGVLRSTEQFDPVRDFPQ